MSLNAKFGVNRHTCTHTHKLSTVPSTHAGEGNYYGRFAHFKLALQVKELKIHTYIHMMQVLGCSINYMYYIYHKCVGIYYKIEILGSIGYIVVFDELGIY